MVCYYDSSIILAGILDQSPPGTLDSLWDGATVRLSSYLLRIECLVGLRRAGAFLRHDPGSTWVKERTEVLREYLLGVSCKFVDEDIEAIVRETPALSDCRALDAVHLATALYLNPHQEEPITVVTLDKRMRVLARKLGFPVAPAR